MLFFQQQKEQIGGSNDSHHRASGRLVSEEDAVGLCIDHLTNHTRDGTLRGCKGSVREEMRHVRQRAKQWGQLRVVAGVVLSHPHIVGLHEKVAECGSAATTNMQTNATILCVRVGSCTRAYRHLCAEVCRILVPLAYLSTFEIGFSLNVTKTPASFRIRSVANPSHTVVTDAFFTFAGA